MRERQIKRDSERQTDRQRDLILGPFPPQDYRARKRGRIQKMVTDRLKQDAKQRDGSSAMESLRDLQQVMTSIGQNARGGAKTKGSRFAHAEKLMYGKVRK